MTKIQRLRQAAGLSQSQLAAAAGISLKALQAYEQGARDIDKASAGAVQALAKALGCTMEDLLEQEED